MAKKERIFVSGGRYRGAPKYELKTDLFYSKSGYFATRHDWANLLGRLFVDKADPLTLSLKYYGSGRLHVGEGGARLESGGGLAIGCNHFSRASLRVIAKWAGWSNFKLRNYLPAKVKQA